MMGRANPSHPEIPNASPRRRRRFVSVSVTVFIVVLVSGLWWSISPWRWLRQAQAILAHDPAQADALAEAALNVGTGRASQAWLIRCRAQLALGNPLEALGAFAQIKHPDQCQVTDWCALIEEARASQHNLLADMALPISLKFRTGREQVLTLALTQKPSTLSERETVEFVQELRRLAGSRADCWRAVAIAEQTQGRFAESVAAYRQAIEHSDASQSIGLSSRRELAQLLINLGQFSDAEPLVKAVMQASPEHSEDQLRLAQLHQSAGDPISAERLLNEILKKEPENLSARLFRGTLFVELQQLAKAQADFESCLRIAPFHDEAHYRLSQTLMRRGDPAGAAKHLQESRRLSELKVRVIEINRRRKAAPTDPKLMDELANLFEALGQPRTSAEWHRAADNVRSLSHSRR